MPKFRDASCQLCICLGPFYADRITKKGTSCCVFRWERRYAARSGSRCIDGGNLRLARQTDCQQSRCTAGLSGGRYRTTIGIATGWPVVPASPSAPGAIQSSAPRASAVTRTVGSSDAGPAPAPFDEHRGIALQPRLTDGARGESSLWTACRLGLARYCNDRWCILILGIYRSETSRGLQRAGPSGRL